MEESIHLATREQYTMMLIDASFRDASEMESGFMSWCECHAPIWRQQGYDEVWIRQRIESAQVTRSLHRTLKAQGLTMLDIYDVLRKMYADDSTLYDLAVERERYHLGLLRYRGNTGDLRQRYRLRSLVYETDKLAFEQFSRWSRLPVSSPTRIFVEQPNTVRVVRDLSTVEELELMLAMSRYALSLFEAPGHYAEAQVSSLMEAYGKYLRTIFVGMYGYVPEDSITPYVPVTIEGPQDHDAYYAQEYPSEPERGVI